MSTEAPAVGIDLGTTNSCVAVYLHGRPEIIVNDVGDRTTPSYVGFSDQETLIGKTAKSRAHRNYRNTIFDVKRLIGRKYNDPVVQADIQNWPFQVVNNKGNPEVQVIFRNQEICYCPEQISAIILDKLKEVASRRVDTPVTKAVITVPAYFNDSQRQATKDAGKLAGLEVLRLLNEPTAAAIAYALDKNVENERNALIFDLGGGTFDVSIITFRKRCIMVKAIDGDTHLGGDDFDNRLLNHFVQEIQENHDYDIKKNRSAITRLLAACEKAKRGLSFQSLEYIDLASLCNGEDFESTISRAKFEDLNDDLFKKTLGIVQNCVDQAGLLPQEIDDIVLVGGSTRIPRLQQLLQEYFQGKSLSSSINPDEAVALGAAIQAASLSSNEFQEVEGFTMIDVAPLSLGVETAGGLMSVFIKRNTQLPAIVTKSFTTARDNQSSINIKIFEGERPLTKDNNLLGELRVTGILPAPIGIPRIDETFHVDESGILSVTALERSTGRTLSLDIDLVKGRLSQEEIERIINDARENSEHDRKYWKILDARNELESYCNTTLRVVDNSGMTMPHRNFVLRKCKSALSAIATCENEDERELTRKLREIRLECDPILQLYKEEQTIFRNYKHK